MLPEVLRYRQRLDNLFAKVKPISSDLELQSQLARFLCVRISGFIEVALYEILVDYVRKRAHPTVTNYVVKQLEAFQNPKMGKILELLGAFDPNWAKQIEADADYEQIKSAVDAVVTNRHQIAHGEDVGISYHTISTYYQPVLKLIELLHQIIV